MKQPRGLESVVNRLQLKFRQLEAPETLPMFLRQPVLERAGAGRLREGARSYAKAFRPTSRHPASGIPRSG